MLDKATMQIRLAFPLQMPFTATNLFIATWEEVGYFDGNMDKVTFNIFTKINCCTFGCVAM